jgi:hypothetical protein
MHSGSGIPPIKAIILRSWNSHLACLEQSLLESSRQCNYNDLSEFKGSQSHQKVFAMRIPRRKAMKTIIAGATGGLAVNLCLNDVAVLATSATEEHVTAQVCVIGGGSGGVGAALAAARAGANVVLIESESILGGTSTNAWVHLGLSSVNRTVVTSDLSY